MIKKRYLISLLILLPLCGCMTGSQELLVKADPLENMEISRKRFKLPQDEEKRKKLPMGCFTGIKVGDSRQTLEDQLNAPEGLLVLEVVENSPAVKAGIEAGDILLEAGCEKNKLTPLSWPSDWFKLEKSAKPNSNIHLLYDRSGRDKESVIEVVKRISREPRIEGTRIREESKVGIIVRAASEVESNSEGLTRGEGCVVVGLAKTSPWRRAGVVFGDIITGVNDEMIKNPHELLDSINQIKKGDVVILVVLRDGEKVTLRTTVSEREREVTEFTIPLLYSYEKSRGISNTSLLFGLFAVRTTAVASKYTLLWFITFASGDTNRLEEVQ